MDLFDHVRVRPGMYLGARTAVAVVERALHFAVYNRPLGPARHVAVIVEADGEVEVRDDGPGVDIERRLLTPLGREPEPGRFDQSGGDDEALVVLNATCRRFAVETQHGGFRWRRTFVAGVPDERTRTWTGSEETWTALRLAVDRELLVDEPELPLDVVDRLDAMADRICQWDRYDNNVGRGPLTIELTDRRTGARGRVARARAPG